MRTRRILSLACEETRKAWNSQQSVLGAREVDAFAAATISLDPLPELPSFAPSWATATRALMAQIEQAQGGYLFEPDALQDLLDLADAIGRCQPRFLVQRRFPVEYGGQFESILRVAEAELSSGPDLSDPAEMRAEASRLAEVARSFQVLATLSPVHSQRAEEVASDLLKESNRLENRANEEETPEPDDDAVVGRSDDVDIRLIFSDL
jgi:hypothetical protein